MKEKLEDLRKILDATIENPPAGTDAADVEITRVSGLQKAEPGSVSFFKDSKFLNALKETRASAVLAPKGIDASAAPCPVLRVKDVDAAFNRVITMFVKSPLPAKHVIDERAAVSPEAVLGENVHAGPFTVIEPGAKIGRNTVLLAGVYVGRDTEVGEDCLIWPNVTIRENIVIGSRVIIHPGAVIGSDGFGFATTGEGIRKLPQIGTVLIEDDVEIGACVTIDRARLDKTVISRGTKLDNLVHIAHNVTIGERSMLAAQVAIAGSTRLGSEVQFGGQSGARDHLSIGNRVRVSAKSGLTKNFPDGITLKGTPAWDARREDEAEALKRRLPAMRKRIQKLEERIRRIEEDAANNQQGS